MFGKGRQNRDAEQKLHDLDSKMAAISRSQAVIEFDLDGVVITANDNFLRAMGYSLSEIQGRKQDRATASRLSQHLQVALQVSSPFSSSPFISPPPSTSSSSQVLLADLIFNKVEYSSSPRHLRDST